MPPCHWYGRPRNGSKERERSCFGVAYTGHPDPRPLLLWDGFEGFPGRKEYPFAEIQIPDDIEVPQ